MERPRPPFLMRKLSVGGAAARPRLRARTTPFCDDQDGDNRAVEVARPRHSAPPEGNRSTYIKERAFTDAAAATGLDTKKAVDRVKASMPSRDDPVIRKQKEGRGVEHTRKRLTMTLFHVSGPRPSHFSSPIRHI
ncbi:hypothetical protein PIB30_083871 [Stylosanthes scabra]|uniref:Uncharacterized protein n=1 Tax=Stylosanthes scabra TaxID=79078 RepID=A0ABU6SSX8_9FABA|nr:hypothetical protein [Stylosanthes scabra]